MRVKMTSVYRERLSAWMNSQYCAKLNEINVLFFLGNKKLTILTEFELHSHFPKQMRIVHHPNSIEIYNVDSNIF